jgi:hypothetical protein
MKYNSGDKIWSYETGGTRNMYWRKQKLRQLCCENMKKQHLENPRIKWDDNIKMDLEEI